jgi:hypothetical protein
LVEVGLKLTEIKFTTFTTENRIKNTAETHVHKITFTPLINMALYVMLLMQVNPLLGQVGEGWALEISKCLGP